MLALLAQIQPFLISQISVPGFQMCWLGWPRKGDRNRSPSCRVEGGAGGRNGLFTACCMQHLFELVFFLPTPLQKILFSGTMHTHYLTCIRSHCSKYIWASAWNERGRQTQEALSQPCQEISKSSPSQHSFAFPTAVSLAGGQNSQASTDLLITDETWHPCSSIPNHQLDDMCGVSDVICMQLSAMTSPLPHPFLAVTGQCRRLSICDGLFSD